MAFVEGLDLSGLYGDIGSVEGCTGRAALPAHSGGSWLCATIDGVGSARSAPATDSAAIGRWRAMGGAEAKRIYTQRAATAECVNAIARGRGPRQFLVRGLRKVKAVALWYASRIT